MADLYLDLRNQVVRVIVAEGANATYGCSFTRSLSDETVLRELLTIIGKKCSSVITRAHLLVPDEEVTVSQHKTQALAMTDAEMIISRTISAATKDPEPLFRLTRMAAEQNLQVYTAEYISRRIIEKYVRMFRQVKVRLHTVTTALQANQALLSELQGEIHQVQVLFELNQNAVGSYFFTPSELLRYEVVAARRNQDDERESGGEPADAERISRRRLYESVTLIHGLYSHFLGDNPQVSVEKIWLSGSESSVAGLSESLSAGTDIAVELLVPGEVEELPEGQEYAALAGFLRLLTTGVPVNFIPPELLRPFLISKRALKLFVTAACVSVFMLVVGLTETRIVTQKSLLNQERLSLQVAKNSAIRSKEQAKNLQNLQVIIRDQASFYDILRDLATKLPPYVYLDGIDFKQLANGNNLILKAFVIYDSEFGRKELLSGYLAALDSSGLLATHSEPVINYRQQGDLKLMLIEVTCQMRPQGVAR